MSNPQDQTQAEELDKILDQVYDYLNLPEVVNPAAAFKRGTIYRGNLKQAIDQYANQRALELLDELEKFINNPQDTPYFDKDAYDDVSNFIQAKRLNLTKEKE